MSTGRGGPSLVRRTVAQLAQQAHDREDAGFDPSGSPWHGRAVFVTGAPRSGTSWLHQMLLTHPDVATGGEMHVFCEGLSAVFANFDHPDPYMHLSTWVTRSELVGLARGFVDGVFTAAQRASRPEAGWVLDKTPNHAHCARLLGEVYPDATFVQIVRNPRDALSSAHDLWADWNPKLRNWAAAARDWRTTVEDCRTHLGTLRYVEVRYEDLLADPVTKLSEIFATAGLPHDDDLVRQAVEFGKAPVNVRPSDRRISAAKWANIDPRAERQIVEVAGDLMLDLGYIDGTQRRKILARGAARRLGASLARRAAGTSRHAAVAAVARARQGRRGQAPTAVLDAARRTVTAAVTQDATTLRACLAASVVLVEPGGAPAHGVSDVTRRLLDLLHGGRFIPVTADDTAAAIEVVPAHGPRQYHRYYVARSAVVRIVIDEGDPAGRPTGTGRHS